MWDMDHGLGLPHADHGKPEWNTLDWSTATEGDRTGGGVNTALIRNLLENENFKINFINHFADLLNTTFKPANTTRIVNNLTQVIDQDINRHFFRWANNNYANWLLKIDVIKNYVERRPDFVKGHIQEKFNLPGIYTLSLKINDPSQGNINLNSITVDVGNWSGDYFTDIPISLKAISKKGYLFDYWQQGQNKITTEVLDLLNPDSTVIELFFRVDTIPEIVINEINYHSREDIDSGDWIEFYNAKSFVTDLSGWSIQDDDSSHMFSFPEGTLLEENGFLVLCQDLEKFVIQNPDVQNVVTGIGFGFSSKGDQVRLYKRNSILMDSVLFDDNSPWPDKPDGEGYTLELLNPGLDNSLAKSWKSSLSFGGTPGYENSVITGIKNDSKNRTPYSFRLLQNYPNPFNALTKINYSIAKNENIKILIYDIQGRQVGVLLDKFHNAGNYTISWNAESFTSGIYFIQLSGKQSNRIIKSILIK